MTATQTSTEDSLLDLLIHGPVREIPKRTKIALTGPLYCVSSGLLRVYLPGTDEHRDLNVMLAREGTFVLTQWLPAGAHAMTLTDVTLMEWSDATLGVQAQRPSVTAALARIAFDQSQDYWRRYEESICRSVPQRLALALIRYAEMFGTGDVILPYFPHEYFAAEIGTSREIVTTRLIDFRKAGAIEYGDRSGITVRVQALRETAGLGGAR